MPVWVIDTLKPKNGLDFPVVEAIDVAVEGYSSLADAVTHFATDTAIAALTAALDSKANKTTTDSLQAQIDQIAQAAGTGSADTEVAQARVGADGTTYNTLKARLDNTENTLAGFKDKILSSDNLVDTATIVYDKYYSQGAQSNTSYSYAIIPMLSSKTYIISQARIIAYQSEDVITNTSDGYEFTPDSDTDVYITFWNDTTTHSEWKIYEKGKDGSKIGTFQHPALSENVLARETGTNDNIAISQKAVTDAINALDAKPVPVSKLSGTTIKDGTDLSPLIIEQGDGGYTASRTGGTISPVTLEGYKYFKLPIDGSAVYYLDYDGRWFFTTDSNGDVVDVLNSPNTAFTTSATAKMLWVTYSTASPKPSTRKIGKNITPVTDTIFLLPANTTDSHLDALGNIDELLNNINLFDDANLVENKYYYNGAYANNDLYSVLIFNVESGKTYQFGCPIRFLDKQSANIDSNLPAKSTYTADYTGSIYCSVQNAKKAEWKAVELPNDVDTTNSRGVPSINPTMIAQGIGNSKSLLMSQYGATQAILNNPKLYGKSFEQATGNLSSGESLTLPKTNVKKNNVYSFMAYITEFDKIIIGHGKNMYEASWIEIDNTNIVVHNYTNADSTRTYEHGLSISDYIYVQITVKITTADISIYSNGEEYKITDAGWFGDCNGDTFAESSGSTLTDCVFTWSSADFRKSIWMFGDSYFGMTSSSRWVKYLIDAGYGDNVLLNAYPGEGTTQALTALNNAIEYYGKPNFIVWCLGMNDNSDSNDDTPSATWMTGVNRVLEICESYGITPIFATIPTVPEIYHEGKNNYVRNSGYRYIDFAKAVGATGDGTWFEGMLSTDEVHPAVPGAIALYYRAIADCPEITFSNP